MISTNFIIPGGLSSLERKIISLSKTPLGSILFLFLFLLEKETLREFIEKKEQEQPKEIEGTLPKHYMVAQIEDGDLFSARDRIKIQKKHS